MRLLYVIFALAFAPFYSCTNSDSAIDMQEVDVYKDIPKNLQKVFEAHGGLEKWNEMNSLTYRYRRGERREVHQVDLKSRKVRLEGGDWVIGFDGKEVWVSPSKASYGGNSARFYHNLIFYFFSMPFVLSDPGIKYETLDPTTIKGKKFDRIRITFNDGVGDAPKDEYIICFDPTTYEMEWLYYTVTYFSNEVGSSYNALHYDKWEEVNGLKLPTLMIGYKTSGDSVTEKRYESYFENIEISSALYNPLIFEIPEAAEIDSLN